MTAKVTQEDEGKESTEENEESEGEHSGNTQNGREQRDDNASGGEVPAADETIF